MFVPQCIGVVMDDCTKFITHCDEKMSESVKKNRLPWQRPLSDRNHISYRSSTPITEITGL